MFRGDNKRTKVIVAWDTEHQGRGPYLSKLFQIGMSMCVMHPQARTPFKQSTEWFKNTHIPRKDFYISRHCPQSCKEAFTAITCDAAKDKPDEVIKEMFARIEDFRRKSGFVLS